MPESETPKTPYRLAVPCPFKAPAPDVSTTLNRSPVPETRATTVGCELKFVCPEMVAELSAASATPRCVNRSATAAAMPTQAARIPRRLNAPATLLAPEDAFVDIHYLPVEVPHVCTRPR